MLPAHNEVDLLQCKPIPRVAAVLDFYGPTDLTMQAVKPWTSPSVARWLGNVPDPAAYARTMSPIAYVRAGNPPVFLVHGEADPVIPFAQSVELRDALQKAGVKAVLDPVPNGGHGRFPAEQQQRVVLDSLRFLQSLGILPEEQ
jgi:acetyl esterase/lipase